ncbi:MAG: AzlD domain-containing protein [Acidihalobacter sp.]|uniref:AzlD domain-containing protein n=1 Tax=Acidihalobacter sp. TaxID=1872108 RepID=UPI00307EEE48
MTHIDFWLTIGLAAAGTYLLRLTGMLAGARQSDGESRVNRIFEPVGPALIAAFLWVELIPAHTLPNWPLLVLQVIALSAALWIKHRTRNLGIALLAGLLVYAALLLLRGA